MRMQNISSPDILTLESVDSLHGVLEYLNNVLKFLHTLFLAQWCRVFTRLWKEPVSWLSRIHLLCFGKSLPFFFWRTFLVSRKSPYRSAAWTHSTLGPDGACDQGLASHSFTSPNYVIALEMRMWPRSSQPGPNQASCKILVWVAKNRDRFCSTRLKPGKIWCWVCWKILFLGMNP